MFRTIPAMKMKPWIILKPFAADTWCMIVVIVVITILILSFILKLEHANDYGYSISALITIAALCQQGIYDYTTHNSKNTYILRLFVIHYIATRFSFSHRSVGQSNCLDSDYSLRFISV